MKAPKKGTDADLLEEATMIAAQCWCDPETSNRVMDPALAGAFARRLKAYLEIIAQLHDNVAFYHGLVNQIGELFGDAARTRDDGSIQQEVLTLNVPELVKTALSERDSLRHAVQDRQRAAEWLFEACRRTAVAADEARRAWEWLEKADSRFPPNRGHFTSPEADVDLARKVLETIKAFNQGRSNNP